MTKRLLSLFVALLIVPAATSLSAQETPTDAERAAQREERERQLKEQLSAKRPIAALDSIWIEELTWMEIRDAMAAGKTTVIVSTGGIEQNGPYVALGKHNYILETACEGIARKLGNALCAPIIKLVPEGSIDPPSGHMLFPGTLSVRQETFEAMLDDVGSSLQAHGFDQIVFIGDSGGNQRGLKNVAERLNKRWGTKTILYVPEFYDYQAVIAHMTDTLKIVEPTNEGYHDFYWATVLQMVTDPETVRYDQRVAAGKATINGLSIEPKEKSVEIGRQLMQVRIDSTVKAIRAAAP